MKPPRWSVHWLGGVDTETRQAFKGFPACVSGDRAWKVANDPERGTYDRPKVTCTRCLAWLKKGDAYQVVCARLERIRQTGFGRKQ